ncbi:hypothetical protein [Pseudomonas putida]|uniref:hypothetical protein n=1 Tax=Pseudomonas putida TaxID=303 RepID=UPI001574F9F8|nr:hypothetical protein [Pseudomonas putida]NTY90420.1 hypothetical protein [Pseudomonas putida]NTY98962.1 hypothetical protein [Pseudomonas putida]NTZ21245.1 hypothetical protein [Pseudomonas putida]NTZ53236.1 hypothetical protein [Pseudomonas putida]NTZ65114.1 hypothetical protein [Pseudomonas putida]
MSIELNEEEMRRALFGGGFQSTASPDVPAAKPSAKATRIKVASKIRVTLSVTNEFEGACETVVYDSDNLSRLVAEMDAKKKYKKKFKYINVVSIERI